METKNVLDIAIFIRNDIKQLVKGANPYRNYGICDIVSYHALCPEFIDIAKEAAKELGVYNGKSNYWLSHPDYKSYNWYHTRLMVIDRIINKYSDIINS